MLRRWRWQPVGHLSTPLLLMHLWLLDVSLLLPKGWMSKLCHSPLLKLQQSRLVNWLVVVLLHVSRSS